LNEKPWAALEGKFDFSIFIDVPESELEKRLWDRWNSYNYPYQAAFDKISSK